MSLVDIKSTFPAANTQDVCLTQTTTGAQNLVFNGNLSATNNSPTVSFTTFGYSRQVSISSVDDLSLATFTVTGTQNGVLITETITGPNATTVYSVKIYDIITSIGVDRVVTNVQVGTGYEGFFNLIPIDTSESILDVYALSLGSLLANGASPQAQVPTTIYSTLDDISANAPSPDTFANIVAGNIGTLTLVKASGIADIYNYPVPPVTSVPVCRSILVQLTGSTSTLGNGVVLIFKQI